jgi:hypothetical protein
MPRTAHGGHLVLPMTAPRINHFAVEFHSPLRGVLDERAE